MMTWFYENGQITANNGPILKIQNLAYSGLSAHPVGPSSIGTRNVAHADVTYAHEDVITATITFCCVVALPSLGQRMWVTFYSDCHSAYILITFLTC